MYFARNANFANYFGNHLPKMTQYGYSYENGRIVLDFERFEYYFGFTNPVCDCENSTGFEYQISIN